MNSTYFKLFANCIAVKGATRSCLCDLQRHVIKFIPTLLYEIIVNNKNKTIAEIKEYYSNEYNEGIDNYYSLLYKEEWGFYTNEPEKFPDIEIIRESPIIITNAIFDYSMLWADELQIAFKQLNDLGCEALQLRFFDRITIENLNEILSMLTISRIKSIELIIKYDDSIKDQNIISVCETHKRVRSVVIHSSPFNKAVSSIECLEFNYSDKKINSHLHCGQINEQFFTLHIEPFIESQLYNSCLNQKISIDVNGNIKNCPSMSKNYGNIKDTSLQQALDIKEFKDVWNIKKHQINVCKDCEFRYICTDCRAYIEKPNDMYSKPLKCGYDPYTAKWEDWSTSPLKQKAIEYYGIVQ